MITALGQLTVGAINKGITLALPIVSGAAVYLGAIEAQLVAQLAANLSLQATLPDPAALLAQMIAAVEALLASIESMLRNALTSLVNVNASFTAQLNAVLALAASLTELVANWTALLSAGGIHAFAYDGTVGSFGGEFGGQFAGGLPGGAGAGGHANALVLITESPTAWAALSALLKTAA